MRRDVFQAIADPTRRDIIELTSRKPKHMNEIAEQFDISRPAISKHVKLLEECGLIEIHQEGRLRYCMARVGKLREVSEWVEQYREIWENRLDALEDYLTSLQSKTQDK